MSNISDKAFIDPKAKIGNNVTIMPFAYIEGDVEIGDNCTIYPFVSIMNGTRMGKNNKVHQGAVISAIPQDFAYKGGKTLTVIGDDNIFRENVIVARSSYEEEGKSTWIGNRNFFMEGVHISHDNSIGYDNVFGYGSKLAGCVKVEDDVILSTNVVVNADVRIGRTAMIGADTFITKDVPPYIIAAENPAAFQSVNRFAMERLGKDMKTINHIANAYRLVFNGQTDLIDVCHQIEEQIPASKEMTNIIKFLSTSNLGLIGRI